MKKMTEEDMEMFRISLDMARRLRAEVKEYDIKLAEHEKKHGRDVEYYRMHHARHMRESYAFDALATCRDLRGLQ